MHNYSIATVGDVTTFFVGKGNQSILLQFDENQKNVFTFGSVEAKYFLE